MTAPKGYAKESVLACVKALGTPTPRTDAEYAKWQESWSRAPFGPDFARTLERELARQRETSCMLLHAIWEREDGFTETRKRLSALETALAAERGKVRTLRSALQNLCDEQNGAPLETRREQWHEAMDEACAALATTEDKP